MRFGREGDQETEVGVVNIPQRIAELFLGRELNCPL